MNKSIVIGDLIMAVLWAILRIAPCCFALWAALNLRSDAPMIVCMLLIGLPLIIVMTLTCWITSSVPALFWRYRSTHETRLIEYKSHKYRQIKLFGRWFFIRIIDGTQFTSCTHWFATVDFESHDTLRFNIEFGEFVNAWKPNHTIESLGYTTFVDGRVRK